MAADRMMQDWRLGWAFPALSRMPSTLPWRVAHWVGRDSVAVRRNTLRYLETCFARAFPSATQAQCGLWARAHLDMLAREQLDASALHRMGTRTGPRISLVGWEHVEALQLRNQGFILVLNHYDRLLTAPVALARRGVKLHTMTMPIIDNPDLGAAQRAFLMKKIGAYTQITQGQWRTSTESLRPVVAGLQKGEAWVILADAWRPEFGRLRGHAFLGGVLSLPTGIERLAQSTGAALLHASTRSISPDRLEVRVEPLPEDPKTAIDEVVQTLDKDVRARPWAWWHWGHWEQMWSPSLGGNA